MSRAAVPLRHDALFYDSEPQFVDALLPFVRAGLATGEDVIAVTTANNIDVLREALGRDAPAVAFVDAADWYRHPARTIAKYREAIDERFADGASGVRVVGEVQFGDSEAAQHEWVRYESALNAAFTGEEAWIVCPYDTRKLPSWIIEHARRTHPHLHRRGRRTPSDAYTAPQKLLAELASSSLEPTVPPLVEWPVNGDLSLVRRAVRDLASTLGMRGEALDRLTLAVNEAVTNALTHGGAPVNLRVYRDDGRLLCEVEDAGTGIDDPLAGYVPPGGGHAPEHGMGLWLARQLCDQVALLDRDERTVIRLAVRFGCP